MRQYGDLVGTIQSAGAPPVPHMTTRTPPGDGLQAEAPAAVELPPHPPAARHRLPRLLGDPLLDLAHGVEGAERGAGFGLGHEGKTAGNTASALAISAAASIVSQTITA